MKLEYLKYGDSLDRAATRYATGRPWVCSHSSIAWTLPVASAMQVSAPP
jgi:hypothetical protein